SIGEPVQIELPGLFTQSDHEALAARIDREPERSVALERSSPGSTRIPGAHFGNLRQGAAWPVIPRNVRSARETVPLDRLEAPKVLRIGRVRPIHEFGRVCPPVPVEIVGWSEFDVENGMDTFARRI